MEKEIVAIIEKACVLDERVNVDSKIDDLSLDSLSFIEILVEMEDLFGIEFEIEELNVADWKTVKDIIECVEGKIKDGSAQN